MYMKQNLKLIIICAVIGLSIGVANAAWNDPSFAPPVNLSIPVNNGGVGQIKSQGLSVNTFFVSNNAQFDQAVFVSSMIRGGSPAVSPFTPTTISFGTVSPSQVVHIKSNGKISAKDDITSPSLTNTTQAQICADRFGYLAPCE